MKKKSLWGFLTLCLMLCLAPFGTKEARASSSTMYIGNQSVDMPSTDCCTYYDGTNVVTGAVISSVTDLSLKQWSLTNVGGAYTLTLNGINITTPYIHETDSYGINYWDSTNPLTVNLVGTNTIDGASWAKAGKSSGFYSNNSVTFTGTGTLNVTAGKANSSSIGIESDTGIIYDSGTVNANGNSSTNLYSYGTYVSGGNITVNSAAVTSVGGSGVMSYGMKALNVANNGGNVVAQAGDGTESYGIYVSKSYTITSGTALVSGGTATSISCGIYAGSNGGLAFDGGTTTASSGAAGSGTGVGIWGNSGSYCSCIIDNDAIVNANATAGGQYQYAIDAYGVLLANYTADANATCQLTATSGTASGAAATSYAIKSIDKPCYCGGTLTASSNDSSVGKVSNMGFSYYTDRSYPGKSCCLLAGSDASHTTNQTANHLTAATYTGNRYVKLFPYTTLATVTFLGTTQGPTSGGTTVVITGTNFDYATGVMFGTTAATSFTVDSSTQITATSPARTAGTPSVTVTNAAGAGTTGVPYIYIAAPSVSSVTATSGYYKAGDINFTVNYSTAVTVTGTPQLKVNIGGTVVNADYQSGSGTTALVFKYTITAGQVDMDGIGYTGLVTNGGTITGTSSGYTATLTYSATDTGVKIDTVAPTISAVNVTPTALTNGNVTVTVTASDSNSGLATSAYSFNGSTYQSMNWKGYSSNQTISGGTIKVVDKAGNVTTYSTDITISNIDTTAPTISSVTKSSTSLTGGSVTITVTATDTNGIAATYGYSFDNGVNWQTANTMSYSANTTINANYIQVKDAAGNVASYATAVSITNIDTTAPTISGVAQSPTPVTSGAVTVTVTATDTNGIAATNGYSFDNGATWQNSNTKTYASNTTIAAGYIKVKDTVGNTASYASAVTITNIDITAPTISSVDKSPTTLTNGSVTITVTATDTNGIAATNGYSFDGGVTWQTSNTKSYSANTTINANSIKVKDAADNVASYATAISITNIDTTAPTISSVAVSTTTITNGAVTVTITATDANGIATTNGYSFDGGSTWQTANTKSYSANTTIAANSIKVKDIAGNVGSYTSVVDITNIDTTAPTISTVNKSTESGPVTVTVTATDTNGIAATNGYSFDGGATWQTANTKTYSAAATISAGSIKVKDTLGNIATYNTAVTITITSSTPTPSASTPAVTPTVTPGTIEKDLKREEGAPAASINNGTDTLKASVFTTTEQAKVAAGEDATVTLKIQDISTSVSTEDKKLVDEKIKKEIQDANTQNTGTPNTEQPSEVPAIVYVDISLYKQIGSEAATKVTQTSAKISISIEVPKELWNTDVSNSRTYRVVRVHDGVVELLDGTYDPATHLFTFETDRFSTYALTYQDSKSATDNTTDNTTSNPTDTTGNTTNHEISVYKDFQHLRLSAKAAADTQTLSYAKVSKADGYIIYGAKYGMKFAKLAVIKGTTTSYIDKDLSKSTCYQYQVKAYKLIKGKKVIIATSKVIYSYTTGKTYANPTKVTTNVASVNLTVGKTSKLTCQVVLPKNRKVKEITAVIRYESTDKAIATISSTGKITAKAKGTCYVYAYAQNGKYVKVKVTTL